MKIPWFSNYCLADNAARIFAAERTSKNSEEWLVRSRKILREPAVLALRFLWQTGDAEARATIACRVAVWMDRPVKGLGERIKTREEARLANAGEGAE